MRQGEQCNNAEFKNHKDMNTFRIITEKGDSWDIEADFIKLDVSCTVVRFLNNTKEYPELVGTTPTSSTVIKIK